MGSPQAAGHNESAPLATAIEEAVHSSSLDALQLAASHPSLTEDLALTLLKHGELPPECIIAVRKNQAVAKYRKVRVAIAAHVRTPRHVSLPLLRLLYTFDLMGLALMPTLAADIKRAAEEVLLAKLETISSGEKLSLARRASGRVAAELLLDKEVRVMQAALENPRLTEGSVAKALVRRNTTSPLVEAVCHHPKWSRVRDIRMALLRNAKTPLARALEFARSLPAAMVREVLQSSRLSQSTKACLLAQLERPVPGGRKAAGQEG